MPGSALHSLFLPPPVQVACPFHQFVNHQPSTLCLPLGLRLLNLLHLYNCTTHIYLKSALLEHLLKTIPHVRGQKPCLAIDVFVEDVLAREEVSMMELAVAFERR